MQRKSSAPRVALGLLIVATQASAVTLNFEDLAEGTTLSSQYAAQGAVFAPNAFTGPGGPSGDWATNTDMTIVSSSGSDAGLQGTPLLVSGNILRSFAGWLAEDGDPSFRITFSTPVSAVSADFAGAFTPADVRLVAYNGSTLLDTAAGTVDTGQFTLAISAASITSVVITPGPFFDWVGVDNIVFTPVPEPASAGLLAVGLGWLGWLGWLARRRRASMLRA